MQKCKEHCRIKPLAMRGGIFSEEMLSKQITLRYPVCWRFMSQEDFVCRLQGEQQKDAEYFALVGGQGVLCGSAQVAPDLILWNNACRLERGSLLDWQLFHGGKSMFDQYEQIGACTLSLNYVSCMNGCSQRNPSDECAKCLCGPSRHAGGCRSFSPQKYAMAPRAKGKSFSSYRVLLRAILRRSKEMCVLSHAIFCAPLSQGWLRLLFGVRTRNSINGSIAVMKAAGAVASRFFVHKS